MASVGILDGTLSENIYAVGAHRLGIGLAAGTFSIQGANGIALSIPNPGYLTIPSKTTPGKQLVFQLTSNQSFIDDSGASTIIGNLFGLPTGVAYAQDIPFYIYAVLDDAETTPVFACSRIPNRTTSPAAANIGCPGTPTANTQGSMFIFSSVTIANYEQNPCVCLGSFRMRMSALDDWTVQTLSNSDGIGLFNESTIFNVPLGTFGAASGTFLKDNAGTAPIFTTNSFTYVIDRAGRALCSYYMAGDGGGDGAGAVITGMETPFIPAESQVISNQACTLIYLNGAGLSIGAASYDSTVDSGSFRFNTAALGNITNADFTNGTRQIDGKLDFFVSDS